MSYFVLICLFLSPSLFASSGEKNKSTKRFAIISDLNGSYGSKKYGAQVKNAVKYIVDQENEIDFVLSTGDMVAGQKSNLDYQGMWESFHSHVTRPLLSTEISLLPSPGNHDAYISRKTERWHYKNSWEKENPLNVIQDLQWVEGVEQNFPFQYAFKLYGALFIALDNTAAQPWTDNTLTWLEEVLLKEKDAQLKFIYGHIPLLPFAFKKEKEYVAKNFNFLQKAEKIFEKYKVDVFFSGHSHVYYPGRRDAHTQFISVPLLGGGPRYLLAHKKGERSRHGFLVVEYDQQGRWHLKHYDGSTLDLIDDQGFPLTIDMPKSKSFPKTHFIESSKRTIYRRSDQPF